MGQLIGAVVMTVVVVLFAMANSHHVELSCVIGQPIRIRMVFLLAVTFVVGAVSMHLYQVIARVSRQRRRQSISIVRRPPGARE